ncbi:hypothetical protein Gotri_028035 [Gossypium trilobum]|uniref:DUF4283 domain-containing protein n=1 Tax=Gossypium trilobum TaxID=34281 RepID=A0A7J9FUE8_9ROSI|nr:hypothetical protein [Gossypium trilobum]
MTGESLTFDGCIGRATKKIRKRLNEPPILDDPLVDEKGMTVISDDTPIASWKDKLLGNLGSNVNSQKEEDFNLMEGDAAKEVVDGIPSIALSKRVHNFIAQRMARTVVVKLIVRFQDDNEYLTAILGGLWTIFDHYLMVRPWTPGFSTDQAQPSYLMVWIRLPGLPEGMYTTSLLKFIGGQPLVSDKDRWKHSTARVRVSTNGINAQESNADDVSQTVTTQIGGVSGTTTKGHSGATIFHPSITTLSSLSLFYPITSQEYASDTHQGTPELHNPSNNIGQDHLCN